MFGINLMMHLCLGSGNAKYFTIRQKFCAVDGGDSQYPSTPEYRVAVRPIGRRKLCRKWWIIAGRNVIVISILMEFVVFWGTVGFWCDHQIHNR
jgi:hypothetical protein